MFYVRAFSVEEAAWHACLVECPQRFPEGERRMVEHAYGHCPSGEKCHVFTGRGVVSLCLFRKGGMSHGGVCGEVGKSSGKLQCLRACSSATVSAAMPGKRHESERSWRE